MNEQELIEQSQDVELRLWNALQERLDATGQTYLHLYDVLLNYRLHLINHLHPDPLLPGLHHAIIRTIERANTLLDQA